MDWLKKTESLQVFLKKYRLLFLAGMVGVLLLTLPENHKKENTVHTMPDTVSVTPESLEASLEKLLTQVEGAGKVRVLLSEASGKETVYQTDEQESINDNTENYQTKTVTLTGSGREETGLIRQEIAPTYRGAVILCQGADRANVKLSVSQAVASVTGLRFDSITVLKMK